MAISIFFFSILDLVRINSWILYKNTTGTNISRKDFLFRLAEELTFDCKLSRQELTIQQFLLKKNPPNT